MDVYVQVNIDLLWNEGNGGAGAWLHPGETYPMSLKDAQELHDAFPEAEVTWEDIEAHHDRSKSDAIAQAEEAKAKAAEEDKD